MKMRESGMPDEATWQGFFDPKAIVASLGIAHVEGDVVDFGCGYGTFTHAAAQVVQGLVYALDIEPAMINTTQARAQGAGLANVRVLRRDFVRDGTGFADATMAYAMLFNILHCEQPLSLLAEAYRILIPGGSVGIIHWNHDPATPRGPAMEIRPRPEQCAMWAESAGFQLVPPGAIDLPPYHYGMRLTKP